AAVEAGAEIVNDVSGGNWDKAMLASAAQWRCGIVLMHTRGRPQEWKSLPKEPRILELVNRELTRSGERAMAAGIKREAVVLDPGFGFGKGFAENYAMLAHLEQFSSLKFPLLAGPSRKGFIGKTLAGPKSGDDDVPAQERMFGTLAAVTACILKGAHIVRVHDIRAARDAALVADE